jgi:hypothetical protein
MRASVALVASLGLLAAAAPAHANGRPPFTNGIYFQPGDAHALYLRTTFGLLISHDDGCTFRWVCEQNIGYGGAFDPKYAIAPDGTIFATTFSGLRVSRDGGCSFTTATAELPAGAPGRIADIWIDAIDLATNGEVWVATAESGRPNDVYRSTDGGHTFAPVGMQSPTIWWKSVKAAASDPRRVYISGYQVAGTAPDGGAMPPTAHVLRSDDAGGAWTPSPLTGVAFGTTPIVYVSAVDPTHPDRLFLTSLAANPPSGDRVYRSVDAGASWTEVLATTDPVRDVVIRADGSVLVATQLGGAFRSADGATFAPLTKPPQLACLGQRGDGQLFGCGANWDPDFEALGRSPDGDAWQKVFRFVNLAGPLACPAGTVEQDTCAAQLWPMLKDQFAATGPSCGVTPADASVDAPTKPKAGGGCCDGGGGGATAGGLALVLLALTRRGRRL